MIIITVVKNDAIGLAKTYKSINCAINDGLLCIKWIIKLSGKNDNSLDLINELPDYCCVYKENDSGIYSAFNQAIRKIPASCNNEFVMFLNAGDEIINGSAINDLLKLQNNKIDYIIASAKIQGQEKYIEPISPIIGVGGLNFCHQAIFYRAQILFDNPFPENYRIAGDYAHFLEISTRKRIICNMVISTFSLDGISSRSVYKTRKENFKAGYTFHGKKEILNVIKMLIIRYLSKI